MIKSGDCMNCEICDTANKCPDYFGTAKTTALYPCPFCGEPPKYEIMKSWYSSESYVHLIYCDNDECLAIVKVEGDSEFEVTEIWNKRAYLL